jgi:hypothetical protein
MTAFDFLRQMTACLGNNLDAALDKPLPLPIGFKIFERYILQNGANALDRFDHIRQARDY